MRNKKMTIQLNNLKEISEEIKAQDNVGTSNPVFVLFEKEKVPTDSDYSDDYYYLDADADYTELDNEKDVMEHIKDQDYIETCDLTLKYELQEALETENYYKFEELINEHFNIQKIYYLWKLEFQQFFLTNKSAEAYLKENSHHFSHPLIVCKSLYRNEEMKCIRAHLLK